jgi:hypothetical protein
MREKTKKEKPLRVRSMKNQRGKSFRVFDFIEVFPSLRANDETFRRGRFFGRLDKGSAVLYFPFSIISPPAPKKNETSNESPRETRPRSLQGYAFTVLA